MRRDRAAEAEKVVRSVEDKLSERLGIIDERLSTAFARDYEMTSEMVREEIGRLRDEIVEAFKVAVAGEFLAAMVSYRICLTRYRIKTAAAAAG